MVSPVLLVFSLVLWLSLAHAKPTKPPTPIPTQLGSAPNINVPTFRPTFRPSKAKATKAPSRKPSRGAFSIKPSVSPSSLAPSSRPASPTQTNAPLNILSSEFPTPYPTQIPSQNATDLPDALHDEKSSTILIAVSVCAGGLIVGFFSYRVYCQYLGACTINSAPRSNPPSLELNGGSFC